MVITTVVDEGYKWFIPLFTYCLREAYPNYDYQIYYRGKLDQDILDMAGGIGIDNWYGVYPKDQFTTNCMRFLLPDGEFEGRPAVMIQDIDVLIYPEDRGIYEQHIDICHRDNLCYEGPWIQATGGYRIPGVFFHTGEWWEKTKKMRDYWHDRIIKKGSATFRERDETMLFDIVRNSGLAQSSSKPGPWRNHGFHMGKYRKGSKRVGTIGTIRGHELSLCQRLVNDPEFMILVKECRKHNFLIHAIFKQLEGRFKK